MFVKILLIYAAANIELRNWKYLQRVGENLIFLLSPLYFIVGFSRHIELYNLHYSAILSHIFLVMMLLCISKHPLIFY